MTSRNRRSAISLARKTLIEYHDSEHKAGKEVKLVKKAAFIEGLQAGNCGGSRDR